MKNGDVVYGKMSRYQWDRHDGGIGDDDGAVHPVPVDWWEHDEELGYGEALELVQAWFIG